MKREVHAIRCKISYEGRSYNTGNTANMYNNYNWSIILKKCESLYCTLVAYDTAPQLYFNKKIKLRKRTSGVEKNHSQSHSAQPSSSLASPCPMGAVPVLLDFFHFFKKSRHSTFLCKHIFTETLCSPKIFPCCLFLSCNSEFSHH